MSHFNFKCAKPHHKQSHILFVCLDPKCKNKRRCCIQCADEDHKKHDIVSIQKFMKEVNSNLQKYNNHPEKNEINVFVNTIRNDFLKSFTSLKSRIIQGVEMIQSKVNQFLNTIHEVMATNTEQMINAHILNSFSSTQTILDEYLTLSNKASKIQLGTVKQVKRKLYDYFYSFEEGNDVLRVQLQKSFQKLQKISSINCLTPKKQDYDFMFSEINKALCIQLQDSKKILQNITAPYNHTICCLDKALDYTNNSFCVRINKNPNKRLWIGVCMLSIVKKNNYFGCFGTGKGTYALDQSGGPDSMGDQNNFVKVSSHHELKSHSIGMSPYTPKWNFKQGDILYIKLDVLGSYLSFYLLNHNYNPEGVYPANQVYSNYYSMEMKLSQNDLYPFVGLNGMGGDQATILSKSQIDKVTTVYGNKWLSFIGEGDQDFEDQEAEFGF